MKFIALFALTFCLSEAFEKEGHGILQRDHLDPAVGEEIIRPRIVNGQAARPGQFPYMVGVGVFNGSFCGGTLIGHKWVLTAAHCLYSSMTGRVRVYLGSIDFRAGLFQYSVGMPQIFLNSDFDHSTLNNDIALIKIPFVPFSRDIAPITLPTVGFHVNVNSIAFTMGWGYTSTNGSASSTLLYTNVRVIDNKSCAEDALSINDNKLCTNIFLGGGPCEGDSGGPLVLRGEGVLIGIVSYSATKACLSGKPDVYTRVNSYLGWIHSHTGPLP